MEQGWIKFHREWLDNSTVTKDNDYLAVWLYLLTNANHTDTERYFNGKKIMLLAGQLIVSCKEIYESMKIERNKLNRILKCFKSEQLIEQQTNNHKTLITLARWDFYQGKNEQPNEQQMSNQRATEQETEKEKEKRSKREKVKEKEINKNDKNERIYIGFQPIGERVLDIPQKDELFEQFWSIYPKKVGKGYAKQCFNKLKPSKKLVDTMLEAIKEQKKSDMWQRDSGQYIPNPSTWINQHRWEDDLKIDTDDENSWKGFNLGITL